jgi:hypothetical protein
MAKAPETLRLFALPEPLPVIAPQRRTATRGEATGPSGTPRFGIADDVADRAAGAAVRLAQAEAEFASAVAAARAAGHSWRRIGRATCIPHQTLHRRMRDQVHPVHLSSHGETVSQQRSAEP